MCPFATLVTALWAMLPAYVPNNVAVVFGGGPPVDGGRTLGSRRLLGDGKTWRGTAAGWLAGVGVALVLRVARVPAGDALGVALPPMPAAVAVALPLGAMLGDMAASFLKRRTGRQRGAPLPGVDQLDFVVGALLAALLVTPAWFAATFTAGVLAVVVVLTPLLHVGTNLLAFRLGLKQEPY